MVMKCFWYLFKDADIRYPDMEVDDMQDPRLAGPQCQRPHVTMGNVRGSMSPLQGDLSLTCT
jgi:hypothetical protein